MRDEVVGLLWRVSFELNFGREQFVVVIHVVILLKYKSTDTFMELLVRWRT